MKWSNFGTYKWNALGTLRWQDLTDSFDGHEVIYTTRDNVSANFLAEANKVNGASPVFKVFISDNNGTLDLDYLGLDRKIGYPAISRITERLFNQPQISSISIPVNNSDGYFNPLGTGLFAVSSVYNKQLTVWKGFMYGTLGTFYGTSEFIPAFTGYIDNIQLQDNGQAVINGRDKGKLLLNNTSEKCTQTGVAGGALYNNQRIDYLAEYLLEKCTNYGILNKDFFLDRTFVNDRNGVYGISFFNNNIGTGNYSAINFLNGTYYYSDDNKIFSWVETGTAVLLGSLNTPILNIQNDGTSIYLFDYNQVNSGLTYYNMSQCYKVGVGTFQHLTGSFFINAQYYNGFFYTGSWNGTISFTLQKYNPSNQTFGSLNYPTTSDLNFISGNNGTLYISKGAGFSGTLHRYTIANEIIGTIISANTPIVGNMANKDLAFNPNTNEFAYAGKVSGNVSMILGYNVLTGAQLMSSRTIVGTFVTGDNRSQFTGLSFIPDTNTLIFSIDNDSNTNNDCSLYFDLGTSSNAGTIGTIKAGEKSVTSDIFYNPQYYNNGTLKAKAVFKTRGGSNPLFQYSSEYNLTIGTFDISNGDKVFNVLQQLGQASNYIQYIDEGGIYHFKRRGAGTTINYNFGTNDISKITLIEGEGVSNQPLYNKAIWGTNTGTVSYEDLPSQGTYGLISYQLQNKWITIPAIAGDICYGIVNEFSYPKVILNAEMRWLPLVKIFDVVTFDYSKQNLSGTKPWQVIGLSEQANPYKNILTLKEI